MNNNIARVNMVLDSFNIDTLQCSQGDTEGREFGFRLMDGDTDVDISNIVDPVFREFDVYKNGTEEILPSALMNGYVDLGSLGWTASASGVSGKYRMVSNTSPTGIKVSANNDTVANVSTIFTPISPNRAYNGENGIAVATNGRIIVMDDRYSSSTSAYAFKQAMQDVMMWYEKSDSTPATSPIIADIKYPQGELIDQKFLYRESPTQKDGLAKLTRVKGNTLAFNQLVNNGNFASTSKWFTQEGATQSVSNNVMTVVSSAGRGFTVNVFNNIPAGHKCLVSCECKTASPNARAILVYCGNYTDSSAQVILRSSSTNWERLTGIVTSASGNVFQFRLYADSATNQFRNAMLIDLTQMFGAGKEPTVEQFNSLFPLPYYSYQSTLLPFKGTSIKTTGANLISSVEQGTIDPWSREGSAFPAPSNTRVRTPFIYLEKGDYTITSQNGFPTVIDIYRSNAYNTYDIDVSFPTWQTTPKTFTMPYDGYVIILFKRTDDTNIHPSDITGEHMYNNNTVSTTNLPTSTYFPNGMKSAGDVYDELTENKAITRVGAYTITSFQAKSGATANNLFSINAIVDLVKRPSADTVLANFISNYGEAVPMMYLYSNDKVGVAINNYGVIYVGFGRNGSVTTLEQANAYVQSNPITVYYELATETETDINTATLVTERGEIPLYRFGSRLYGDCVKAVSKHPGIIDGKIRLINSDGVAYSNKVMIRIERSTK